MKEYYVGARTLDYPNIIPIEINSTFFISVSAILVTAWATIR